MTLNGDKFEHLQVGKNLKQENYSYKDPSGNTITEKKYIKDLGVYLTDNLSWSKQIDEVVAKARAMSGWALRTFSARDKNTMLTLWNSRVRPVLDYCSPLWSPRPWNYKEIDFLEETQRTFTRQINGMEDFDYAQRLKALKLYSIQRRHERYKIIYAYKIKEKLVPNISEDHGLQFFCNKRHGYRCKIPSYPLHHNKAGRAREDSFTLTACNLWNAMPKYIRNISGKSVDHFKRSLDKILVYYPDIPRCSATGHLRDRHGRNTNSLTDIYIMKEHKRKIEKEAEAHQLPTGGPRGWPGSNQM